MSPRLQSFWLVLSVAVLAGALGVVASVAVNGPGALLNSALGRQLAALLPGPTDPPGLAIADIGETSPRFTLAGLDGKPRTIPTPGKPVIINYWASWCPPCREEMPLLADYSRQPGAIEVVGIALDTAPDASAFLTAHPVPFAILVEAPGERDSSVQLGNRRGVLPFSVLIGADGRVLQRRFGAFHSTTDLQEWSMTAMPAAP